MADVSTTHEKQELRQRLESMKQAYARTLHKVEKSDKAKRARSHVQRRIAEQTLLGANDTSPSCTHRLSRTLNGDSHNRQENPSPIEAAETASIDAGEAPVVNAKTDKEEVSKSLVATRQEQRKRRSVSFIIPKEKASSLRSIDEGKVELTDTCHRASQDKALDVQQTSKIKRTLLTFSHEQWSKNSKSVSSEEASTRNSNDETQMEITDSCLRASEVKALDEQHTSKIKITSHAASHDEHSPKTSKLVCAKAALPSALSCGRRDGFKSSSIKHDRYGRSRLDEKVILVVPESQFTEPLDASLGEGSCNHSVATAPHPIPGNSQRQRNITNSVNESQNNPLSDNEIGSESSKDCTEKPRAHSHPFSSSLPLEVSAAHHNSKETKLAENASKPSPDSHQSTSDKQKRRAGRKNRRRSRIPRELTVSDISMKEVVESQSTEEGSHTWIEGLMYPVEYYVRRTRSMTYSQCSQSQLGKPDSQRYMDTDTTAASRKGTLTVNPNISKVSPTPGIPTLFSGGKNLTDFAEGALESDSDTLKSQLSESLLKTTPAQPEMNECTDFKDSGNVKLTRSRKNRRLQRRQGISKRSPLACELKIDVSVRLDSVLVSGEGSVHSNTPNKHDVLTSSETGTSSIQDNKHQDSLISENFSDVHTGSFSDAVACKSTLSGPSDVPVKSQHELTAGKLNFAVGNLKLSRTEFVLPEEDFGAMKLLKLQRNSTEAISSPKACTKSSEDKEECRTDCDVENRPTHLFPKSTEDDVIDCLNTSKTTIDDASVQALHQQTSSVGASSSAPPLTNAAKCQTTLQTCCYASDCSRYVVENLSTEMKPCVDATNIKQSRICQQPEIASARQNALLQSGLTANRPKEESQSKSILHSQLSPTQFREGCGMAFPISGCSPGWSPRCTPEVINAVTMTKSMPRSPDKSLELDCQRGKGEKGKDLVGIEDETNAVQAAAIACASKPGIPRCADSTPRDIHGSSHTQPSDIATLQPSKLSPLSNSQHSCKMSTLSVLPTSPGATRKSPTSISASPPEALSHKNLVSDHPTQGNTSADGNVKPPNLFSGICEGVSVDPRGNINQISPFAGVATGTPPGRRAEEPWAMSQCEVKSISEDDAEEVADGTDRRSRNELALMGCLQHDLPWEPSPTVREVTGGGMMNVNGEEVSVLAVLYQHTLVIWWNYTGAVEWQILQSWVTPKDEEFMRVRLIPCSKNKTLSLVVAGMLSSCAARVLNYDTVTKETRQLAVNLVHSAEIPVPYLLCATSEQDFVIAVKDTKNESAVFLVRFCIESSAVQTLKLSTGTETSLTSLLLVEGAERILIAITCHNNILLWNCKTGELIKNVLIQPVHSGSVVCVNATSESGLLFLVMVFRDDPGNRKARCHQPAGVTMVLNPLTDKMATLVEYHPPLQHASASLVDGIIHDKSLLVKLSDGSLHQWDIFSGFDVIGALSNGKEESILMSIL